MQFVDVVSRKVLKVKSPAGKVGDPGAGVDVGDASEAGGLCNSQSYVCPT